MTEAEVEMRTPSTSDAKDLVTLAERMGIPAAEAIRQVGLLIADVDHAAATTAVAAPTTAVAPPTTADAAPTTADAAPTTADAAPQRRVAVAVTRRG
jgi:hypothetical protein